jgi:hypothetical protein
MKSFIELYKCAVLTTIAALLLAILLHMPAQTLTLGQMRAAGMNRAEIRNRIPLVYVEDGKVTVDNLDEPLHVEVENTVEAEIVR